MAIGFAEWMHDKDFIDGIWHYSNESGDDFLKASTKELLTQYQNSKK
jgi:hypothetical protein